LSPGADGWRVGAKRRPKVRALKRLRVGLSRLLTGLAPTERDEHGDDDAGPKGHAIAKRKQTVP
jgi:hypothetical protein